MRQAFQSTISFSEILFNSIDAGFKYTQSINKKNFLSNIKLPQFKKPLSSKIVFIGIGIILLVGVIWLFQTGNGNSTTNANDKPFAPVALKTQEIKKELNFPIKDENGKILSKMQYEVQRANIQDEILVKGQRARAVEGRVFLIIDIKITNSYKQGLQINSKDYMRLIVNGNKKELVAADIHNDPVEVQAISTKTTRIGFPINETDRDLVLQVGEINGKKELITLTVNK